MDKVQPILERMVPELEALQVRDILSPEEVKSIVSARRDVEWKLAARAPQKDVYLQALRWELQLEALLRVRIARSTASAARASSERKRAPASNFHVLRRITFLFQRATARFTGDVELWLAWVDAAIRLGMSGTPGRVFPRALAALPREPKLWLAASAWAWDVQGSVDQARMWLQRALRINPASGQLWVAYFRLELLYVHRMVSQRVALGLPGQPTAQELLDAGDAALAADPAAADAAQVKAAFFQGAVPRVVASRAVDALHKHASDDEVLRTSLDLLAVVQSISHPASQGQHLLLPQLARQLLTDIATRHPREAQVWTELVAARLVPVRALQGGMRARLSGAPEEGAAEAGFSTGSQAPDWRCSAPLPASGRLQATAAASGSRKRRRGSVSPAAWWSGLLHEAAESVAAAIAGVQAEEDAAIQLWTSGFAANPADASLVEAGAAWLLKRALLPADLQSVQGAARCVHLLRMAAAWALQASSMPGASATVLLKVMATLQQRGHFHVAWQLAQHAVAEDSAVRHLPAVWLRAAQLVEGICCVRAVAGVADGVPPGCPQLPDDDDLPTSVELLWQGLQAVAPDASWELWQELALAVARRGAGDWRGAVVSLYMQADTASEALARQQSSLPASIERAVADTRVPERVPTWAAAPARVWLRGIGLCGAHKSQLRQAALRWAAAADPSGQLFQAMMPAVLRGAPEPHTCLHALELLRAWPVTAASWTSVCELGLRAWGSEPQSVPVWLQYWQGLQHAGDVQAAAAVHKRAVRELGSAAKRFTAQASALS